jgi:hypothetical protein
MRPSRSARSLLAVGCLLWLTGGPVFSRTSGQPVELIMSKLPPDGTPAYRAFRVLAGKSPVQVLTLTRMEVWALPRNRVAAVKRAAGRFGVAVDEFPPDWNHVLRPVPAPKNIGERVFHHSRTRWKGHAELFGCPRGLGLPVADLLAEVRSSSARSLLLENGLQPMIAARLRHSQHA